MKLLARGSSLLFGLALSCASAPRTEPTVLSESGGPPRAGAAASVDDAASSEARAIEEVGRRYLALLVEISPETATSLGIHERDHELDDRSAAAHAAAVSRMEALASELRTRFPKLPASRAAQVDLALLLGELDASVQYERAARPLARDPSLYLSPLNALFLMIARDYAPADVRARAVVSRLERVPVVVAEAKRNLGEPPRVWTEIAIESAREAKGFLDAQRAFLRAALPADVARIDAALGAAIAAYEDYRAFLTAVVLPRSSGDFAAGRALFVDLLAKRAFVEQTPEDLRAMGERVFAETVAQMNEVARRIDPNAKGFPEVTRRLKRNHPTAGALLGEYRREVARARAFLVQSRAVPLPPGDDLEVVATPPFLRETLSAAYDRPPPFDTTTAKGFFFVTPVDPTLPAAKQEQLLREHDHGDIVDTSVHEAYPGHHLQLSFARLHPSVVRKVLHASIFSEGWALYAEELMAELGYYSDEERLMQLEWTLVRAARVVIDVGLHVGGMTIEEATKILTDQVHLEAPLARSEVRRYTTSPTQPLAYLTGRQILLELRERCRARDGARFTLEAFHRDVLSHGTIPPSLVAREILGDP